MSQRGSSYALAALLGISLLVAACGTEGQKSQEAAKPAPPPIVAPFEYGNGVYYFAAFGERYYRSLAAFLKEHPELRCSYAGAHESAYNPGLRSGYAFIDGHAIMCTDTTQNAQEETVP